MPKIIQKEDIFIQLIKDLEKMNNVQLRNVAEAAEITVQTLFNWCWGTTLNPHLGTVMRVSRALGYEVHLIKSAKSHLRKVS